MATAPDGTPTEKPNLLSDIKAFDRLIARVEILSLVVLVFLLIFLYVGNIALRVGWRMNIAWLETLLKPFVLWIGLLGASLATRESRHISVEAVSKFTTPSSAKMVALFANAFALAVTLTLATVACFQLAGQMDESPNTPAAKERLATSLRRVDSLNGMIKEARQAKSVQSLKTAADSIFAITTELTLAEKALEPRPQVYAEVLHLDLPASGPFPERWEDVERAHWDLGLRVRHWQVSLIVPLSLLIMSFRFFLHIVDTLASPQGRLQRLATALDTSMAVYEDPAEEGLTEPEALAVEAAKSDAALEPVSEDAPAAALREAVHPEATELLAEAEPSPESPDTEPKTHESKHPSEGQS